MPSSRRAGGITKRCECRGADGKLLGTKCPQLKKKSHGAIALRQELPLDANGKRRPFRRTGYATVTDAQADLSRLQAILDLPGSDEEEQRRVGDMLADVMKRRAPIPAAAEVSRRLGVGVPLDGAMTVGEWLDTWVESKRTRTTTTNGYRSHIRVHLKPGIGHYRLDRFNVGHCQEFFDSIDDANEVVRAENAARREQEARCKWGKRSRPPAAESARLTIEREKLAAMPPYREITGPATKQRIRATLRAALNAAIRRQLISFNAAQWVELEPGKRPKGLLWTVERVARWRETGEKPGPVMVWTPDQLGAFLDAAESDRLYAIFHLITHHGLRRGEGVGQDWDNLDVAAKRIRVAKEIVVDGWTPIQTDPKTDGSAASVKIDRETIAVLREHRARQLQERDAWNEEAALKRAEGKDVPDWSDNGKMFTALNGEWLHPEVVSTTFNRIVAAADLPPINLRDARHGAAALVKAGGGDLHDAKVKLRHSTITLTSDTYMELFEEYEDELTERAAAVVPRARRGGGEPPAPGAAPEQGERAPQPASSGGDGSAVGRSTDNESAKA
jgi:integrase